MGKTMAEEATLQVRVLWEGEVIERKFFGESQPATASKCFDNTVDKYQRSDSVRDGGVTVQLIDGDDVLYETFIEDQPS